MNRDVESNLALNLLPPEVHQSTVGTFLSERVGARAVPASSTCTRVFCPRYRGVLATFRALLNGDAEIGCTLHWIDSPGIDVGPVVETVRVAVARERSLLWHIPSLYRPGTRLILSAIERLERSETITGTAQDPSAGAYYSFPTEDDLIRFTAQGWRLFDREDVSELLESYSCSSMRRKDLRGGR